jgi:nitrate reductase gamma subunit
MSLVLLDYINTRTTHDTEARDSMELLLLLLAALIGLAAFDFFAVELGVDSRSDSDDPHAPLYGAH